MRYLSIITSTDPIVSGIRLIAIVAATYILMHVFFFGVPIFTLNTEMGIAEIAYTASNLVVVGCGAYSIYQGRKQLV